MADVAALCRSVIVVKSAKLSVQHSQLVSGISYVKHSRPENCTCIHIGAPYQAAAGTVAAAGWKPGRHVPAAERAATLCARDRCWVAAAVAEPETGLLQSAPGLAEAVAAADLGLADAAVVYRDAAMDHLLHVNHSSEDCYQVY